MSQKDLEQAAKAMLHEYHQELLAGGEPQYPEEAAEIVREAQRVEASARE